MHGLTKSVVRNLPISFVCLPLFQVDFGIQYRTVKSPKEALSNLIYFHILAIFLLWSFVMTCTTCPGYITDEWKLDPNSVYKCNERKKNGEFRYCKYENCYKPDRAHYCKSLGRNVLKMDHYCPWVSNGIGFYNYKYFFLTLFYSNLINLFMLSNIYQAFNRSYYDPNSRFNQLFYLSLIATLTIIISIIIIPFTLFHVFLISLNKTTIEFFEWKESGSFNYNSGIINNFVSVFGNNIFLWFLPIGKPPGDGIHFTGNNSIDNNYNNF